MSLYKRVRAPASPAPRKRFVPWSRAAATRTFTRKRVYGRMPGELKFHDIDVDDAVVAANGTIQNGGTVNIIPQGVTEVQRVGRKCTITNILWRYEINLPAAANLTSTADTVRVIMYLDKQANLLTATSALIMESDDFQSFFNLANVGRFKILMDRTHNVNALVGGGDGAANDIGPVRHSFQFYKKCSIPIEFTGATGALTEQTSNNIGVLLLGKNNFAGFESKLRLRFSDGS